MKYKVRIVLIVTMSVLYGYLIGNKKFPPYRLIMDLKHKILTLNLPSDTISPNYDHLISIDYTKINPAKLLTINDHNADSVRSKAVNIIFGQNKLPQQFPDSVIQIHDERYADLVSLSKLEKFYIKMEYDLHSIGYIFTPTKSNGQLLLFQQGHDGDFLYSKHIINYFLDRGYTIYCFCMPLMGLNNTPIVNHPKLGKFKLLTHDDFQYLEHPISYFVEPIFVMINYAQKYNKYKRIVMIGLSGGGWTTAICAGIDTRINVSFPIAGSLPMYIKLYYPEKDIGDFEQHYSPLFSHIDYLDFYALGSSGKGRKQMQIYNQFDPCCWSGVKALHYEKAVATIAKKYGGQFGVFIDSSHKEHKISEKALEVIFKALE